jgi:rSAM/selenodomain-associated transferase 2
VIPALDEEAWIGAALRLLEEEGESAERVEVVVADGGSRDGTVAVAESFRRVRAIRCARGRAQQMNAGARATTGRILLFLHADSRLPAASAARLVHALDRAPLAPGGAFRFRLDSRRLRYRLLEHAVALRTRFLHLPYGDQGIFVRREAFDALGGFRLLPRCEDLDLVRRMRRLGPLLLLDEPVVTSARRWEQDGFARATLRNWYDLARYEAGLISAAPSASGPKAPSR